MNDRQQMLYIQALKQTLRRGHNVCAFIVALDKENFCIVWSGKNLDFEGMELRLKEQLPFSQTSTPIKTEIEQ